MRRTPNININSTQKLRDRSSFKEFVLKVNTDTFIYSYFPDLIEVNDGGYINLTLVNKKFIY